MSSGTHRAKRERAKAEGVWVLERQAQELRVSVSSPSGLKCRAALPVLCASAPRLKAISLAHPPSLYHAVPNSATSASALNDGLQIQVSPPLWPGRAHCPVRGYHPGRCVRTITIYVWIYLDVGPAIGKFISMSPYRFFPRLFLCTPSFRRCGVTGTVCCGSG